MRRIIRNKKGITPVLSSVLLMAIAVTAMAIALTATYIITSNLRETMGERFVIEDVWFKADDEIAIYLRNTGKIPLKIAAVYINHTASSFTPLWLDDNKWINLTHSWSPDGVYHIGIATTRGKQVRDYYSSPA